MATAPQPTKVQGLFDDGISMRRLQTFDLNVAGILMFSGFNTKVYFNAVALQFLDSIGGVPEALANPETITIAIVDRRTGQVQETLLSQQVAAAETSVDFAPFQSRRLISSMQDIRLDFTNGGPNPLVTVQAELFGERLERAHT